MAMNRCCAFSTSSGVFPDCLSGWYFSDSFLCARLMSASPAPRLRSRSLYGSASRARATGARPHARRDKRHRARVRETSRRIAFVVRADCPRADAAFEARTRARRIRVARASPRCDLRSPPRAMPRPPPGRSGWHREGPAGRRAFRAPRLGSLDEGLTVRAGGPSSQRRARLAALARDHESVRRRALTLRDISTPSPNARFAPAPAPARGRVPPVD
eukprot:31532-Pelagococcus_subviridis.AAC.15